jgi:hypothetical protein
VRGGRTTQTGAQILLPETDKKGLADRQMPVQPWPMSDDFPDARFFHAVFHGDVFSSRLW